MSNRSNDRISLGAKFLVGILFAMSFFAWARQEGAPGMGQVVIGKNADGRLEVFRVSSDGELQHRWQKEPGGEWSPWWRLGGSFFPGLAVGKRPEGQLEVFAVNKTNHSLACIRQTVPNGPSWTSWTNLGGRVSCPVAVGQLLDGRLEVFGVDPDSGHVHRLCQTDLQEGWSVWADLGGNVQPGLAVSQNKEGRMELFAVDARNNSLLQCQQTDDADSSWSPWTSLGGTLWPGLGLKQNPEGLLEVFAVNRTNGAINHITQVETTNGVRWSQWTSLGGDVQPGIAVGENSDGRMEVFVRPNNQTNIYHSWQIHAGEPEWSLFWPLARDLDGAGSNQSYPAVARNQDGTLLVVARDSVNGNRLNYKRQISAANNDWLDWYSMDQPAFPYTSRKWQQDDGLPHTLVQAIAQTRDGYLWVGTRGGLARFDGVHFTLFDAKNMPELKSSSITALCTDKEGALWIGTEAAGVFRLKQGVFDHFGRTNGLAGDSLTVIYEDRDGAMWFGTQSGASQYKDKKFTSFTRAQGLLSNEIRSIYRDRRNDFWIGTPAGLNLWTNNTMVAFTVKNGLPDNSIRGIIQDKGGRLWFGSDKGMIWHNIAGGFYAYDRRFGLSDSIVSAICEDREGNLWVGTYGGLNRFRDGRFFNENNNEGARYDKVNAIFEDRDGNLWVGSIEGLIRLTPKRFFPFNDKQGLTYNNTSSVLEDHAGNLWVGTWGGGLNQIKEDGVTAYTAGTKGLSSNFILSLCEGRDGSIWIGADKDGGLNRLKNGTFTRYTRTNGLINAPIKVIHEDRAGALWIGTAQGLSCLTDGKFINYTKKDNLSGNDVRAICEDHAGDLWFGTDGGLSRWVDGHFTNFSFTDREGSSEGMVTALFEDGEKNLWVGTAGKGLKRYKNGRFTSYTTQQGLFSDEILENLEDDSKWLWMSCSKGVFRVLKADLDGLDEDRKKIIASISYGVGDGMESTLCSGMGKPAAWKARDGRFWFATTKGLVVVDPQNVRIKPMPPPVYIEQLIADKKPLMRRTATYNRGNWGESPVQVMPGRGELEFHFTVLSFQKPEKNRLKYMLQGVDQEWVDADPRRVAHYMNVNPGSYRFRVIGCDSDGVWNETGASLDLNLLPHFWQTWWFHSLIGLGMIIGISGTVRSVTKRRMQRKLDLLERQRAIEHERARIAKDIHDDLGSSLTRIMMLGDRMEESLGGNEEAGGHARKIVSSARATVQSLDEIVWAVNPENDTLDSLIGYIGQFADQFFESTGVRCRRELPLDSFPMVLDAEIRHDLFLVLKEALNNVLKHARASEVRLQIGVDSSSLTVLIEDNGCGFDVPAMMAGQAGNGLKNMRKRVEALGGQFSIESRAGTGTKLTLSAQLQTKQ